MDSDSSPPPASLLRSVVVRLCRRDERQLFLSLLRAHHYLGYRGVVGESLAYVAEANGQWLALLLWAAAAFKCPPRDAWIGWHPAVTWQRLHLVANNVRFLILPGVCLPNLASRVLGLCARRLSQDWQQVWGHPLLLVETFVDPERFSGVCYRAAGWLELGRTRGFARCRGGWRHHGHPKLVLVRELEPKAREALGDPTPQPQLMRRVAKMKLRTKEISSLLKVLRQLPDPRKRRGRRHGKTSLLAIAVAAVLSGARGFAAIAQWARECSQGELERFGSRRNPHSLRYEAPSEPTLRRLLQSLDVETVDQAIGRWIASLGPGDTDAVAFDGKTLRGARRRDGTQVHLLSAVDHGSGSTMAQEEVSSKSNEIPLATKLLDPLPLAGKRVTADAMHVQDKLARFLVEDKQADYCLTVKKNQPQLKEDIDTLFNASSSPPQHQTTEKAHGRLEIRRIWTSTELNDYVDFPYCGQVARIERLRTRLSTGESQREQVAIITSLRPQKASPAQLLQLVRGHWSIENRSHWVRDVTFDEDRSQVRSGKAPRMMAILRNLVIALLRFLGFRFIPQGLRHFARRSDQVLKLLGL